MLGIVDGGSVICDSMICELFANNNNRFFDRLIEREYLCISFAKTY